MASQQRRAHLDKKQLEQWLEESLVPVEPSSRFLKRLHARLVTFQGQGALSGWMLVVVFVTALMLGVTVIGLIIRSILAWLNVLGLMNRKGQRATERIADLVVAKSPDLPARGIGASA
jgi:hypothetical protein